MKRLPMGANSSYSSPAETVLTLDVALTFWAITKFSAIITESDMVRRPATITCKLFLRAYELQAI